MKPRSILPLPMLIAASISPYASGDQGIGLAFRFRGRVVAHDRTRTPAKVGKAMR